MNDDETSVQAEWDAEIDRRAQEVMDGKVKLISGEDFHRDIEEFMAGLISGEESERRIDALFAKHGRQRKRSA